MTTSHHDDPWLEARDLSIEVRSTGHRVVDGISFQVARGERWASSANPAPGNR